MIKFEKIEGFDWDSGNIEKNLIKHGIGCQEAEEIFLDTNSLHTEDKKHSSKEERLIRIGKSFLGKVLIVIYTIRNNRIRIISVRDTNKNEMRKYLDR